MTTGSARATSVGYDQEECGTEGLYCGSYHSTDGLHCGTAVLYGVLHMRQMYQQLLQQGFRPAEAGVRVRVRVRSDVTFTTCCADISFRDAKRGTDAYAAMLLGQNGGGPGVYPQYRRRPALLGAVRYLPTRSSR
eukprot:1323407-Rhodomonas_salina.2